MTSTFSHSHLYKRFTPLNIQRRNYRNPPILRSISIAVVSLGSSLSSPAAFFYLLIYIVTRGNFCQHKTVPQTIFSSLLSKVVFLYHLLTAGLLMSRRGEQGRLCQHGPHHVSLRKCAMGTLNAMEEREPFVDFWDHSEPQSSEGFPQIQRVYFGWSCSCSWCHGGIVPFTLSLPG